MRQKLVREPFEKKIEKAGQLIRLAKEFPRQPLSPTARLAATARENTIIAALRNRSVLEFSYNGQSRIVEPQTYGISTCWPSDSARISALRRQCLRLHERS